MTMVLVKTDFSERERLHGEQAKSLIAQACQGKIDPIDEVWARKLRKALHHSNSIMWQGDFHTD